MNTISKNVHKKAILAVIIGNVIFGFSFLFSKIALQYVVPSMLIATRFMVAFLVLNVIAFVGSRIKRTDGKPWIEFSLKGKPLKDVLLLALFQPILYFAAENYGILYTSSAFAGIIISVIPLAGIVADVLIMHAKVERKQIICASCSVVGVALTTLGAKDMNSSVKGLFILLVAVAVGALFYVYSQKSGEYYNALERTYVMFGAGSIVYVIVAAIQCRGAYDKMILEPLGKPALWVSIAYLAVISSVVAFLLLNFGSTHVSVSQASLFANLTTVISIVAGVVILHESFTTSQIVGAVVILSSVYFANR